MDYLSVFCKITIYLECNLDKDISNAVNNRQDLEYHLISMNMESCRFLLYLTKLVIWLYQNSEGHVTADICHAYSQIEQKMFTALSDFSCMKSFYIQYAQFV